MSKTRLTVKIIFKPGSQSDWVEWYGCHDFKISDNLITFWNLNDDGDKVERTIPLNVVERIYGTYNTIKEESGD